MLQRFNVKVAVTPGAIAGVYTPLEMYKSVWRNDEYLKDSVEPTHGWTLSILPLSNCVSIEKLKNLRFYFRFHFRRFTTHQHDFCLFVE